MFQHPYITMVGKDAPEVLVLSDFVNARLSATCHFIFSTVLQCRWRILTDPHEIRDGNIVINYSSNSVKGYQIQKGDLIEKETEPKDYHVDPFDEQDLFSFVFYFISRLEEWRPFDLDEHGRFEAPASVLSKHGLLEEPVVDKRIMQLRQALEKEYPHIVWPGKRFVPVSTVDIDNLYAYRYKGLLRSAGGLLKEVFALKFDSLKRRLRVWSGRENDPFDVYDRLLALADETRIPLVLFFLLRSGTRHDRTVSNKKAFAPVLAYLEQRGAYCGLHPSYRTFDNRTRLNSELTLFNKLSGRRAIMSRQHFLRFDIRSTPKLLLKEGITIDFSMGFASKAGFRAGTSHPFFYYDFDSENESDLLFVPFCIMDGVFFVYDQVSPDQAWTKIDALAKTIHATGGFMTTVYHERTFDDQLYEGYGPLYERMLRLMKDLAAT